MDFFLSSWSFVFIRCIRWNAWFACSHSLLLVTQCFSACSMSERVLCSACTLHSRRESPDICARMQKHSVLLVVHGIISRVLHVVEQFFCARSISVCTLAPKSICSSYSIQKGVYYSECVRSVFSIPAALIRSMCRQWMLIIDFYAISMIHRVGEHYRKIARLFDKLTDILFRIAYVHWYRVLCLWR